MGKRRRPKLSHLDERGEVRMVDVSEKSATARTAVATARVRTRPQVRDALLGGGLPKGDALAAARLAGIMAAKRTSDWIPLCHPLRIEWAQIEFSADGRDALIVRSAVRTTDRTGVEMEALVGAAAAALTLYDMAKSADKAIVIGPIQLERKEGGKSGTYERVRSPRKPRRRRGEPPA